MRPPAPWPQLVVIGFVLGVVFLFLFFGALNIAFEKLGLDPRSASTLVLVSLLGSFVNLPLLRVSAEAPPTPPPAPWPGFERPPFHGQTMLAMNVGGGVVPLAFSIYLIQLHQLPLGPLLLGVALVTLVAYAFSRPVPGVGVALPIFVAPLSAAAAGLLLAPEDSAPVAYISGVVGVLLGADVLRLKDIRKMGAPIASIGGAGTFDGIFLTGIVAALLA